MSDLRSLHYFWTATVCVLAYLSLDLLCGPPLWYRPIYPVWHPAAGLAVFMLFRFGGRALAPLSIAATASCWVMPILPQHLALSFLLGFLPFPGYAAIAWFMRKYLTRDELLANHRVVLIWVGAVAMASLMSSLLYASLVTSGNTGASSSWAAVAVRYGVAEIAGILTIVSLAFFLADQDSRIEFVIRILRWESLAYVVLIALVFWIALHRPPSEPVAYYLLLLPLVWAAARQGTAGSVASAVALEIGVTAASFMPGPHAAQMSEVQMLVLTLILAGLLIGVAVDQAKRATNELRQSLRLAAAGEMAGALAHELNQPLTALSAYGSACARLVETNGGDPLLKKTVGSIVAEAQRASNVLKRLREFFRTGSTQLEPILLADLVHSAAQSFEAQAQRENVSFCVQPVPPIAILGDRVQLEIVLRNLLANAFQALAEKPVSSERRVTIDAGSEGEWAWIRIADNGPGIANKIRARLFEPFTSMKSTGLGLGLAISKAIVETHGGHLDVEPSPHGVFRIKLPVTNTENEVSDERR